MQVSSRRLLIPVAVVVALSVPGLSAASAASPPKPQAVTGVVQTIIREHPEQRMNGTDPLGDTASTGTGIPLNDTTKVLRVGTSIVALTPGSLPEVKDGSTVSVTLVPGAEGTKRVIAAHMLAAPAETVIPSAHQLYVALVIPAGVGTDPTLTEAATRTMVSTVSSYWASQTGGQVAFETAEVLPVYHSAYSCGDGQSSTNTYSMWSEALAKMPEADGPGKHLVVVAPAAAYDENCFFGLGTIGAVHDSGGNTVFVSGLDQSLLAHELGHNLGLYHSNSLRCGAVQDRPVVSLAFPGCQADEYDDLFDVMGYSGPNYGEGNLNAVHLDGMGLLPGAVRKIAAGSGVTTVRITPLSTTTADRTLKITDPGGANYFVEYRTRSGRDEHAAHTGFNPAYGVRVLRDNPAAPPSAGSYELDDTPTSLDDNDYNRSIPVGDTFTAASRRITIRVDSQDSAGANLTISDSAAQVDPSRATLSVRARAWVGAAITAATKVSDASGSAVGGWSVTLQKRQQGSTTWRPVRTLLTSSAGAASYRFVNGVSGSYRWVTAAAAGAPTKASPSVAVTSAAKITERRTARWINHGTYLAVSGVVSPVPSPVVCIQYRIGAGPWRTGSRATVRGTTVTGRIAMNARTSATTRLYVRSMPSYVGSVSGSYVTTVR